MPVELVKNLTNGIVDIKRVHLVLPYNNDNRADQQRNEEGNEAKEVRH